MSAFPLLKTGAVTQYPADKSLEFSTRVLRFVDGAEQRFPGYAAPLRRWVIRLTQLDEDEAARLSAFFLQQAGRAGTFSFTDPWDETTYPSCSFEDEEMAASFAGVNQLRATLSIRENRT